MTNIAAHLNLTLGIDGDLPLGDTHVLSATLYRDGGVVSPTVSSASFVVRATITSTAALISKVYGAGVAVSTSTITVTLNPSDQTGLAAGTYVFGLELVESDGRTTTVSAGTITFTQVATS